MLPTTLELLKKGWNLYRANTLLFLKYTAMVAIPVIVTSICRYFFERSYTQSGKSPSVAIIIAAALIIFVLYLITLWGSITLVRIIYSRYMNAPVDSFTKELSFSISLVLSTLWVIILTTLSVFGGLVLFIIPDLIFSIWFFFSVYVRILDNQKGSAALSWSKQLVQQNWWEVLWLIISTTLIVIGGTMVVQSLLRFVLTLTEQYTQSFALVLILLLLSLAINVLVTPLSAAIPTILYAELKKRKLASKT